MRDISRDLNILGCVRAKGIPRKQMPGAQTPLPRGVVAATPKRRGIMTIYMGQNAIKAFSAKASGQPYSLTVLNENSKWQQFALFQTIPQVIGPSVDPLSLAWMVGGAAAGSPDQPSTSSFNWTIDYSLTVGYIQQLGSQGSPRSFQTARLGRCHDRHPEYGAGDLSGTVPLRRPRFSGGSVRRCQGSHRRQGGRHHSDGPGADQQERLRQCRHRHGPQADHRRPGSSPISSISSLRSRDTTFSPALSSKVR